MKMKKILIMALISVLGSQVYAQVKISELDVSTSVLDNNYFPIVDPNEASTADRNKRMTFSKLSDRFLEYTDTVSVLATQHYVLDNIEEVTINNDGNNRITTANGDGTFNAESNFTFDGSNAILTGSFEADDIVIDDLLIDGNVISSTDATTNIIFTTTSLQNLEYQIVGGFMEFNRISTAGTMIHFFNNSSQGAKFLLNSFGGYSFDIATESGVELELSANASDIVLKPGASNHVNLSQGGFEIAGSEFISSTRQIKGVASLSLSEQSSNPVSPGEGKSVIWQSDGTGSGDDGDIMITIRAGGVTKTITLIDFSAF